MLLVSAVAIVTLSAAVTVTTPVAAVSATVLDTKLASVGYSAVAPAAAQLLIVAKSEIASCFPDQVVLKSIESAKSLMSKSEAD